MPEYRIERPASPDDVLEFAVAPLASAYAEAAGTADTRTVLASFTPGQRLLCAWFFYWDDVTNGGHDQYFSNYTGDLWEDALKACDAFGVPEAALLREAIRLFPGGRPAPTPAERQEQLSEIDSQALNDLDARFYAAPASDEEVRRYMDEHPEDFFVSG